MSESYQMTLVDSEMVEIAAKVDECRVQDRCAWARADSDRWKTSCAKKFEFPNYGTPEENDYLACPWCGKLIETKAKE